MCPVFPTTVEINGFRGRVPVPPKENLDNNTEFGDRGQKNGGEIIICLESGVGQVEKNPPVVFFLKAVPMSYMIYGVFVKALIVSRLHF